MMQSAVTTTGGTLSVTDIISQLVVERDRIERALSILRETGSESAGTPLKLGTATTSRPKRRFSAATRRKMALAQQKRYAALRGEAVANATKPTVEATKPFQRKISAKGLANIRAAQAKRRAAEKKRAAAAKKTPVAKTVAVKKVAAEKSAPVAAKKKTVAKKATRKAAKKAIKKAVSTANPAPVTEAAASTV